MVPINKSPSPTTNLGSRRVNLCFITFLVLAKPIYALKFRGRAPPPNIELNETQDGSVFAEMQASDPTGIDGKNDVGPVSKTSLVEIKPHGDQMDPMESSAVEMKQLSKGLMTFKRMLWLMTLFLIGSGQTVEMPENMGMDIISTEGVFTETFKTWVQAQGLDLNNSQFATCDLNDSQFLKVDLSTFDEDNNGNLNTQEFKSLKQHCEELLRIEWLNKNCSTKEALQNLLDSIDVENLENLGDETKLNWNQTKSTLKELLNLQDSIDVENLENLGDETKLNWNQTKSTLKELLKNLVFQKHIDAQIEKNKDPQAIGGIVGMIIICWMCYVCYNDPGMDGPYGGIYDGGDQGIEDGFIDRDE